MRISPKIWERMAVLAWEAARHARLYGKTAVGATVIAKDGRLFAGCNVEHRFRSHDIHAEVNALSTMVAAGAGPAVALIVVAKRKRFTPCGSCLDWVFELGGGDCRVAFQATPGGKIRLYRSSQLMPHYPE